jgi:hypothetical protein
MSNSIELTIPAELAPDEQTALPMADPATQTPGLDYEALATHITNWKKNLHAGRAAKRAIWDECWAAFRGVEDFSNKEDWQSKIVLPKAMASVKQASSVLIRLISQSAQPWRYEPIDKNNTIQQIRAEKKTTLVNTFMNNAKYLSAVKEANEGAFVMGLAVLKPYWGYETRLDIQAMPDGSIVRNEVLEGKLFVKAVDPYNFFWLPGSSLNNWAGTIEVMEMPYWKLKELVKSLEEAGLSNLINHKALENIKSSRIDAIDKQATLRHQEMNSFIKAPSEVSDVVKVTEYYGPIFQGEELVEKSGHVFMIGDKVLIAKKNTIWNNRPPYIGWSPLLVPFRTEGMGLIEPVRQVLRNYSKITNQAVDSVAYSMLPMFELFEEAYENPDDFNTGLTPGKVLRRKAQTAQNLPGMQQIQFRDVSTGAIEVAAQLDRAYQEGALVGEIQQALPRFRGAQTASEIEIKDGNQQSFFGSMGADMEQNLIAPLVDYCGDLVIQFLDTANDPRISQVLGADFTTFAGMTHAQKLIEIQGDFTLKVSGISEQFEKSEMLNNLVQFMNLIGQNPMAWLPYINQIELLKRIVEGFRPQIHDIDKIVVTQEVAAYQIQQQMLQQMGPQVLGMLPQLIEMAQAQQLAREQQAQPTSTPAS